MKRSIKKFMLTALLLCVTMMLLVSIISHKRNYKPIRTERMKASDFMRALKEAALPLCLPIIIIGGIRLGIFTPTEAGYRCDRLLAAARRDLS